MNSQRSSLIELNKTHTSGNDASIQPVRRLSCRAVQWEGVVNGKPGFGLRAISNGWKRFTPTPIEVS